MSSSDRGSRSRFPVAALALFAALWLPIGFATGTGVLLGPVRRLADAARAGGWSPAAENAAVGAVIVAFGLGRGLEPGAQIVLDARQFNARFAHPVTPYTRYLIASQVHPDTLAGLPHERTYLWHSGVSDKVERLVREHYGEFWPVPGGSTVVLRALPLLRMLGFHRVHLFGFDSCVRGKTHHAYAQAENDNELTLPVICGGKHFDCTPWQLSQASEFRGLVGLLGDEMELAVYGDGLIAAMIAAGYEFAQKEQ